MKAYLKAWWQAVAAMPWWLNLTYVACFVVGVMDVSAGHWMLGTFLMGWAVFLSWFFNHTKINEIYLQNTAAPSTVESQGENL